MGDLLNTLQTVINNRTIACCTQWEIYESIWQTTINNRTIA